MPSDGDGNHTFSGPGQYHDQPSWVPDNPDAPDRPRIDVVPDNRADPPIIAFFEVGDGNQDAWIRCEKHLTIDYREVR